VKEPCAIELSNQAVVRKSPYATAKINAGDTFTDQNVGLFRPVASLGAHEILNLMGRRAINPYKVGDPISEAEVGKT